MGRLNDAGLEFAHTFEPVKLLGNTFEPGKLLGNDVQEKVMLGWSSM